MNHLHAVPAIGDIGEQRCIGRADDHVLGVVQLAVERHFLMYEGPFGPLDIHDHQPVLLRRDIGVGACEVHAARIGKRHGGLGHGARLTHPRDIEELEPIGCRHPQVAELHRARPRITQRDGRGQAGLQRIVDDDEVTTPSRQRTIDRCREPKAVAGRENLELGVFRT